jgi:phenylalanyl-tRNA synthetase beta chain
MIDDKPVGLIGELHPEVLERWQITMPCSAFELALDPLV